jgi:hypothetical protein
MDMQKKCNFCGEMKSQSEYYQSQRGSKCKSCTLKLTREYKTTRRKNKEFRKIESAKQKERRLRLWQNTLVNDSKRKGVENTLTVEDINEIYENQQGLCFWFKIPLIPSKEKKHPQQPSIDRLDITKGYTKDNIVLACYSANIGRNENDVETWKNFISLFI